MACQSYFDMGSSCTCTQAQLARDPRPVRMALGELGGGDHRHRARRGLHDVGRADLEGLQGDDPERLHPRLSRPTNA